MPSFDIVSEVDMHELANAVDQANRELTTRFDFRGVAASFEKSGEKQIVMTTDADFQLVQMVEMLKTKMVKRGIDVKCLEVKDHYGSGKQVKQEVVVRQGLDKDVSKKIVKMIKDAKLKVQAAIQGDQVRVTGKKRDDLQTVIAFLREADLDMPLQYNNFRD
ncbi:MULTISPECIES: YajQ family cyclic di-GMP-binding protein [Gammaproteobacteria]|uniref:YajQ family cyclic di-GMP-binding protein n=1 Tax=Gammaproteobacteria TaxID=1236 RepID=UPI001ADD43BD|nr:MULTISPECIES: YajQ family cyclic di-GMP-binding protein [Gammaproteobacteria]MBO9481623.1 YajQ family cyclic di-GMP-binding protein [Salinisphaera sp. G21_0]MBO9493200.1 YajQ family cyclic di-GMP-binding protein [Thalassotalea sp. G20_0]